MSISFGMGQAILPALFEKSKPLLPKSKYSFTVAAMPTPHEFNERLRREALPRARRALRLRQAGETWEAIGKLLGVTRQRAAQLAARAKAAK